MRVAAAARLLTGSPTHLLPYNSESQSIEKPGKLENPSAAIVTMKRGPLFWPATAVRLGGFRLPSSLSPALFHHLRRSLSGGCAHSTAPLPYRPAFPSRALSGTAGRVDPFERSNGLAYAGSFLF